MWLLDIGNTTVKVKSDEGVARFGVSEYRFPSEPFYYINVNPKLAQTLATMPQAQDIAQWFVFESTYRGLGVDRIAACYTIENGVVVDAGSAITVDVMREGRHMGGFIMPGLSATKASFAKISSRLVYDLKPQTNLQQLPQSTEDALGYATLKPVVLMIADVRGDLPVYVTGGDGQRIVPYMEHAVYCEELVFEGMQKAIKEKGRVC